MAVTGLMHMKESPGIPHTHLRNAIDYILDVKHDGAKTNHGELVGGNAGLDHKEILNNFLQTKKDFGKTEGRQGYHFFISFAKGETDAKTAYAVVKEFCEEYLGDNYDYVFAIHTDKEHMHGHIVFNSVSRVDGYKYHYKKGDWKKYIQPVTDKICVEHGLNPLTFEEKHKVGMSYASWIAEKEGKFNWGHVIRADIDYAIDQSDSMDEYWDNMKKMGYRIRDGYSKKRKTDFVTYKFTTPDGKTHSRRSYNLPDGYKLSDIAERIRTKEGSHSYEDVVEQLESKAADYLKSTMLRSTQTYKRLYQAVNYYRLPNPYAVPSYRVRKDMIRLDSLIEDCRYLKENKIVDVEKLKNRIQFVKDRIQRLEMERKTLYGVLDEAGEEVIGQMEHYHRLQMELTKAEQERSDRFEEIEDEMEELTGKLPPNLLETKDRISGFNKELSELKRESRILNRILETEKGQTEPLPIVQIRK